MGLFFWADEKGTGHFWVLRVIYWHAPPKYWDFLAASEKINFEICRAFEEQGIAFSLPMRITHTSIDSQEKPVEVRVVAVQGVGSGKGSMINDQWGSCSREK